MSPSAGRVESTATLQGNAMSRTWGSGLQTLSDAPTQQVRRKANPASRIHEEGSRCMARNRQCDRLKIGEYQGAAIWQCGSGIEERTRYAEGIGIKVDEK